MYNLAKLSPEKGSKKGVVSLINPRSTDMAVAIEDMKKELIMKHSEDCLPIAITFSPPWDSLTPDGFSKCDFSGYLIYCVLARILSMYYGTRSSE
jgi:hypothetical protein